MHRVLCLAGMSVCLMVPAAGAGGPVSAQEQYARVIKPFLTAYCLRCHNADVRKGKLSLHDLSGTVEQGKKGEAWLKVLEKIELGEMPPKTAPRQPTGQLQKQVMDWILAELGHAGIERDQNLLARPEFGNHVDHTKLFDGSIKEAASSVPRVWRLRAGLVKVGNPFPEADVDYAALQVVDEPMTLRLRALSEQSADQLLPYVLGRKIADRRAHRNPAAVQAYGIPRLADPKIYLGQAAPTRAQIEADVDALFQAFLSRKPTAAERQRYADFMLFLFKEEADREASLATVMRAMLLTPEAYHRMELGRGAKLPDGRRLLSSEELAIAVPLSLGSKEVMPGLKSRADVEKAVRQLVKADRRSGPNPRFLEFMRQYFEYDRALEVFKGERHKYHAKQARQLVEETDLIVTQILMDDKDVFKRLLTTDQIVVGTRTGGKNLAETLEYYLPTPSFHMQALKAPESKLKRRLYLQTYGEFEKLSYMAYYGLEPDSALATSTKQKSIIKSPVPRAGILTQPSWLQAHSTFTDNHVVLRGKWVREKLLGGSIPEVPIGVDAAIPDTPDQPLRQRLAQTKQAFCARCHQKMDPLGYPFEIYDDFGRYRVDRKERLINGKLHDQPVDSSGAIVASGVPGMDGPVKDAVDMIHKIAATDRARQVFVRHVFRFFMGRNETLSDSQSLIRADQAFVRSGGSFQELVVSILTSDSFLYRKDPG